MANLILQTAFLGDALLAIPLIKNLKQISNEPIHLIARKGVGQFFADTKLVDKVYEIDKSNKSSRKEIEKEVLSQKYKIFLCPHRSPRSQLFGLRVRAEKKIGFYEWWNLFSYDERVRFPFYLPDALRQLKLLCPLNDSFAERFIDFERQYRENMQNEWSDFSNKMPIPEWASMRLDPPKDLPEEVLESLKTKPAWKELSTEFLPLANQSQKVLLAPGSVWNTKRWTLEGYIEIARRYKNREFEVFVVGSSSEFHLGEQISREVNGVKNICGRTSLTELFLVMKSSSLLVCNDSGAMHLASVAGLPTVAIFGPTTLSLGYRPWQNNSRVVQKSLTCRPCGKHGHHQCPLGTHDCMKQISVDDVQEKIKELL